MLNPGFPHFQPYFSPTLLSLPPSLPLFLSLSLSPVSSVSTYATTVRWGTCSVAIKFRCVDDHKRFHPNCVGIKLPLPHSLFFFFSPLLQKPFSERNDDHRT